MSSNKHKGLTRRTSGLMALEPRFMFDGAAVTDAIQTMTDSAPVVTDAKALVPQALLQAEQLAQQKVADFLSKASDQEVFSLFNGGKEAPDAAWAERLSQLRESLNSGETGIQVVMMDRASQFNAIAAFAANGPDGKPTIFVNPYWAGLLGSDDLSSVLVEEIGHWMDAALNPGADTAGDEGQKLAEAVLGSDAQASRDGAAIDSGWVTVDGVSYEVEFASFNFVNAYEMVYDLDNDTAGKTTAQITTADIDVSERWADKEQNLHYFNASTSLGVVSISDGTNGQNFSGNDVSAIAVVINGQTYYGWISRPIKANGIVRGFYFWTDTRFTSLAAAQADGNQDGDRTVLNNRGFVFVVDQAWFNTQISSTAEAYNGTSKPAINNTKDGNLGSITVANVGSSSDRVDSALNSVLTPNSAPLAANDSLTVSEDSGTTTVAAASGLLSNDTDANQDSLTITGFSVNGSAATFSNGTGTASISGVGSITINANGSYTFTPVANYNGPVPPITYTVSDGNGGTATAVLSITVTPVNDPPASTDDLITTTVNTPKVLGIQDFGTYSDADNDPFAGIKITALPTDGTLQYWTGSAWASVTLNQTFTNTQILQGLLRFAPDANEKGGVNDVYTTLQFKVYDGTVYSNAPNTLTVKVTGYQAPVANADTNTVTEAGCNVSATPATGNVLTGGTVDTTDTGIKTVTAITAIGSTKTVTASTNSSTGTAITGLYGTLTIGSDGSYSYVLNNNLAAIDGMNSGDTKTEIFTYTLSDGQGGTATTTLTLTINGTNDAPVGTNDFNSLEKGTNSTAGNYGTLTVSANGVLGNDTDVDNVNSDLVVKLVDGDPLPSGTQAAVFYASSPITNVTVTATTLTGYDSPPSVLPSTAGTAVSFQYSTNNGTTWSTAKELDGGDLKVYYVSSGGGAYYFSDNVALYGYSNQSAIFRYVQANPAKEARWSVALSNPTASSSDKIYTDSADISNIQVGDVVTWTGSTGTIKVTAINTATGEITLDNDNNSSTTYSISLINKQLTFNRPSSITVSATQEYLEGSVGYLILNQNGGYTYTLTTNLTADQIVDENFTYTVVDPADGCTSTATLSIRVYGVDAPTLVNDTLVVDEDSGNHYTFNGVASSTDSVKDNDVNGTSAAGGAGVTLGDITSFKVAGDNTTYTAQAIATADSASNKATIANVGTLRIYPDGTIAFDPVDNYLGPVPTVTYTRSGSDSNSYTANLIISIRAVDDASTLVADTQSVPEDTTATGNVLANDSDVDNTLSVASFTVAGTSGTQAVGSALTLTDINGTVGSLTLNATGLYTFTPAANWNGTVPVITYTTNTGSTSTLTITVTPVNDAPTLDLDANNSSLATGSDFARSYTNGATGVSIGDIDTTVSDVDDINMESATVELSNPQSGDVLTVGTLPTGISYTSSTAGGVVTISFTGSATLADYQTAIKAITFSSTGNSTVDRIVSVKVNDGDVDSNTAYTTITVAPDARLVTVMGTVVNEASPNVVFEVSGVQNQWVSLHLGTTGNGTGHASMGTDFLPNLQYLVGGSWTNHTGGLVQIADASGKLLVRTAVLQDQAFETTSATFETLKLTAKNAAGTANVTTDPSNVQADGTAQIRDDGQGSVYLDGNLTFNASTSGTGFPAYLDDDRPITVNNIAVNEASPKGVFTVTGSVGQIVRFALLDRTATIDNASTPVALDGTEDYGPGLEIWTGSGWSPYTPGNDFTLASATTFVRTTIVDDDPFEGQHTFVLGVTRQAAFATVYGTGSIYDDGTGDYFAADNNTGTPNLPSGIVLDDDRVLTINSPLVNEGSDFVVFTLSGNSGQTVSLQLQDESNNGTVSGKANILENQTLKIWNGLDWVDYNANNLPTFNASGKIFVRVDIIAEQDTPFEGGETFKLNATLTGQSTAVTGVATIIDDGTGVKYTGTFTNGSPVTDTTDLDNDRPTLSVTGGRYNEGSPRAVFTVNATAGQSLTLDVLDEADTGKAPTGDDEGKSDDSLDTAPIYYSLDGGATWQLYNGTPIIAGALPVLVAVDISNESDNVYEGEEQFKLVVTSGGQTASAFGTIVDDGTGTVYPPNVPNPDPDAPKDDDRPVRVNNIEVNENSPWAVFRVNGTAGQSVTLALQNDNDPNTANALLGTDSGTQLQYFNGTAWVNYSGAVTLPTGGELLVRVAINDDEPYEGPETFQLAVTPNGGNAAYGTATILDDGTGSIYPDNTTGNPDADAPKDDDRPVRVNNIEVNENSPWAVFRVNGTAGQSVTLALQNDNDPNTANALLGTDSGTQLQYFNGTAWVNYSSAVTLPTGGELLVRVAINDDEPYEGPETFQLAVTPNGGNAAYGTATILDDGTGSIYPDNTTGNPDADAPKDDDRPVRVNNIRVNEASPYAVFTLSGTGNQGVVLALQNDNKPDTADAKLGTDTGNPLTAGRPLQYFNGSSWTDYTPGSTVNLVNGQLLVRTAIVNDNVYEGPETFQLSATPNGGNAAYGTATILDDGTGDVYPDNNSGAINPNAIKDDDRPKPAAPPPPPAPVPTAPAPAPVLAPPPPVAAPVQSFASALTPLAPALVPADPPMSLGDAVTSGSGYQIPVSETAAPGLSLYQGVTDQFIQSTDVTTKVSLPFDAFIHSNKDAVIKLEAKLADDSKLPDWVQFDPTSGVFEVTPPKGFKGKLDLKVLARDDDGREAVAIFQMFIGEQPRTGPQSRESLSEKLRMAGKRPITLVRVADLPHKAPVREATPVRVHAG